MDKVSSYTSWQPLESVVVGRVYDPEYFSFISNPKVKSQLGQLLDETNEDLDNLASVLKQFGAEVLRPELPDVDFFQQRWLQGGFSPMPPLTPRDWQISLGDKLLRLLNVPAMDSICNSLSNHDGSNIIDPHRGGFDANHVLVGAAASCIVRVGTDVFFDRSEWMTPAQMEWIRDNVLDSRFRVRQAQTNGHGDAVFAILKPGVIISSIHDADINYKESFPGWEVHKVWDASIWAAMEVGQFCQQSFNGRWWLQTQDPTAEFTNFVDTYLEKWTGFVKETVFDVNCLVLDEQNVIFSSYNREVFDFCRRHGIEPIICEQRHKYFFDSGISCCTQDLRRRGGLETYL
jgi:hypothetical protein